MTSNWFSKIDISLLIKFKFFSRSALWCCATTFLYSDVFLLFRRQNFNVLHIKTHGEACWVAGWGRSRSNGVSSDALKSIGINLFSHDYCMDHRFLTLKHFVAKNRYINFKFLFWWYWLQVKRRWIVRWLASYIKKKQK